MVRNIKKELYEMDKKYINTNLFNMNRKKYYGLEDLEGEVLASDEIGSSDDSYDDPEVGMVDDAYGDDIEPTEDGVNAGDYDNNTENDWDANTEYDDLQPKSAAVNMMQIIGNYTNLYGRNMATILSNNKDTLDFTGDISKSPLYSSFVVPAVAYIEKIYNEEMVFKDFTNFNNMIQDTKKMNAICGSMEDPFIYSGLQLMYYEVLQIMIAMVPFMVRYSMNLTEVLDMLNFEPGKIIFGMIKDMGDISPMFGDKIYYVEPQVSEITGKSEEVANTPYANVPEFKEDAMAEVTVKTAGESIMNLIEIKNSNALVEYSLISKALVVISGLVGNSDLATECQAVLQALINLVNQEDDKVEAVVDETINFMKKEVIFKLINRLSQLVAAEQSKVVEESEDVNPIENNVTDFV